jgi:hypothetical protein
MNGLTLEQVRRAGRFAWHGDHGLWTLDGVTVRRRGIPYGGEIPEGPPVDGWCHVPSCDCEFCGKRGTG